MNNISGLAENRLKMITRILSLIMLTLSFAVHPCDLMSDTPDTKGTDFWVTFTPNFHNNKSSSNDYAKFGDSLYLFITTEEPTSGSIEYRNRNGQRFTHNFSIPDVTKIYTFKVSWFDFELAGFNNSGDITSNHQCERPAPQSFHITSEKDVTIYAHSQAVTTSDAFNVLPTDALGENYFVLTYKSDGTRDGTSITGSSTPSQFAIVAPFDSTVVTIRPSTPTHVNGAFPHTVVLNKGDSYLVQAAITVTNLNSDLTGTEINSTKPVALFAGQQRSTMPLQPNNSSASRDFICAQIPPIQSWGNNAILVPYPQPVLIVKNYNDIFRILAAYDGTEIFYNDVYVATIDKGEYFEGDLLEAASIRATAPILVAQYKRTSQNQSIPNTISDPFIMIIPQVEQFGNFYRFINIQAYEFAGMNGSNPQFSKVYDEQYLTIVAPQSALDRIELDGALVAQNRFTRVASTKYYFATIRVTDGVHTLISREPVGIYVYGYGYANSYGYFGGMNFKILDYEPPVISYYAECYSVKGTASDSTYNDTKLREVTAPEAFKLNSTVTIEQFAPHKSVVKFEGRLNDIYQDGSFQIIAVDSIGLQSKMDIYIAGFTVKAIDDDFQPGTPIYESIQPSGRRVCFAIKLHNYGKYQQQLNSIRFRDYPGILSVSTIFPIVLQPGEERDVEICAFSESPNVILDSIILNNDCSDRTIYAVKLTFLKDGDKPQISSESDPCNELFTITATDSLVYDYGIAEIKIDKQENCSIEQVPGSNSRVSKISVRVLDPWKDAHFKIFVIDSAGNQSEYERIVPGFTVSLPQFNEERSNMDYASKTIGKQVCDSIELFNYGRYDIEFKDAKMFYNVMFSIPQEQFPINVPPGESRNLYVCYRPVDSRLGIDRDTLDLTYNCLHLYLAMEGEPLPIIRDTESKCEVPLKMKASSVPWDYFLDQNFPNPAEGTTSISFGLPDKSAAKILIRDIFGKVVIEYMTDDLPAGIYKAELNISNLAQGLYFYELQSGSVRIVKKMSVAK